MKKISFLKNKLNLKTYLNYEPIVTAIGHHIHTFLGKVIPLKSFKINLKIKNSHPPFPFKIFLFIV